MLQSLAKTVPYRKIWLLYFNKYFHMKVLTKLYHFSIYVPNICARKHLYKFVYNRFIKPGRKQFSLTGEAFHIDSNDKNHRM